MAEVSQNASRGAVLSNKNSTAAPQYDLRSWQGLTEVLKRAREAGLSDTVYAEFRNMVLSYAQTGGDPEMRKKIDAVVSSFTSSPKVVPQNVPPPVPKTAPAPDTLPIATPIADVPPPVLPSKDRITEPRRNTLSFMPKSVVADEPVVSVVDAVATPLVRMTPSVTDRGDGVPVPVAVAPISPLPPTPVHARVSPPIQEPTREPIPVVEVPSTPNPLTVEPVAPSALPGGLRTLDEHKARIAEIKRTVNNEIGNPITLVDAGNPVGREYMTALLTAMKASGNGGQGLDAAMEQLEHAFTRATEAAKKVSVSNMASVVREVPREVPIPVQAPVRTAPPRPSEEPVVMTSYTRDEEPVRIPPVVEETRVEPVIETPAITKVSEPVPTSYVSEPDVVLSPITPVPSVVQPRDVGSSYSRIPMVDASIALSEPALNKYTESGVGRTEFDPTSESLGQTPSEVATRQSDLASSEVTNALCQLLTEWSLFEGSGLFGIGPGGAEHPLYKRLAPLSMGEVLAGRWERATPEIRRTLKDYVDAWRHEQGIAYNPTENFEHYLRRVVQRIMKRQKGEPDA